MVRLQFFELAHFSGLYHPFYLGRCHDKLGFLQRYWKYDERVLRTKCFVEPFNLHCAISTMSGDSCVVRGNARVKVPQLSYHHFPSDHQKCALWLKQFKLHHRLCSRHFCDGNPQKGPDVGLGRCFAFAVKKGALRTNRAKLVAARCFRIDVRHRYSQPYSLKQLLSFILSKTLL